MSIEQFIERVRAERMRYSYAIIHDLEGKPSLRIDFTDNDRNHRRNHMPGQPGGSRNQFREHCLPEDKK